MTKAIKIIKKTMIKMKFLMKYNNKKIILTMIIMDHLLTQINQKTKIIIISYLLINSLMLVENRI